MITLIEPGFYKIAAADYHADPCPEPSLSGSVAIPLVERSPRHAWVKHPKLNPKFKRKESKRFDFGKAAHDLLFEGGNNLVVIEAPNYLKKATQEARDAAYEAGRIPILVDEKKIADDMVEIARDRIKDRFGTILHPDHAQAECTMIWREGPIWCRGLVDLLPFNRTMTLDYKTTIASARPEDAEETLYDLDYHFKAAFYERGLDVLDPEGLGRHRSFFLFQEIEPPHECSFQSPTEGGMTIARKQITYAIESWQRCIAANEWPGYSREVHYAHPPARIERRWMARELSDPHATGALAPSNLPPSPIREITL